MQAFTGTPVLVTGAGRGIGKRLALGFAREGARVGLVARSKAELDLTRLEIEHAGGHAIKLRADVRDFDQVCAAVDRFTAQFGELEVLVCAAAVQGPIGPLFETQPKAWVEPLQTNLIGVYHACRSVLPAMIQRRRGKIVVLAGGGSAGPRPNFSAYAASKCALVRLVETLAEEVRDHNVQVNCLDPGSTYTHMTDEILGAGEKAGWRDNEQAVRVRLTGGMPPEKQLEAALFLASPSSNHVSGKLIHVNDDWRRLANANVNPEAFTLRRVQKL